MSGGEVDIDDVLPVIGSFGRYQKTQFALLCVPAGLVAAIIAFNSNFVSGSPVHWCKVPALINSNLTVDQRQNLSIPRSDKSELDFDSCHMYDVDYENLLSEYAGVWPPKPRSTWTKSKCKYGWEYDKSVFDETLVTKFDLVCDKDWLPPFATSLFYLGSFIGNFILGVISDRYGRRIALFTTLTWMISFTAISVTSVNYYMYCGFRFLVGFTFPSIYQIPFVGAMELMAPDKRTFVGNVIATVFASGLAILGLMGYLLRNWFDLLLASSLPFTILFVYYWILPESPRWLLSQGKVQEAEEVLRKAAKQNGKTIPKNLLRKTDEISIRDNIVVKQPTIWDLVKTPNMRKKLLVILFCWPINAVVYTVLSFQASGLGVNEYLGFAISGLVEIPAYGLIWYVMDTIGRRWSIFGSMMIGGVACIITLFIPVSKVWVMITLAMIGKCGIAASFSVIYVFAGELNPTIIRSTAIAVYASAAGIALIGAPYLLYLEKFGRTTPLVICGVLSVLGAISIIFLPETLNEPLPQTMQDGEEFGKGFSIFSCASTRKDKKRNYSGVNQATQHNTDPVRNGSIQYTTTC